VFGVRRRDQNQGPAPFIPRDAPGGVQALEGFGQGLVAHLQSRAQLGLGFPAEGGMSCLMSAFRLLQAKPQRPNDSARLGCQ
jgi:hypothetical protein